MVTAVAEREVSESTTKIEALVQPPPPETPHQKRERLRQTVISRGVKPGEIESIVGDCNDQTAQQIRDLESWLSRS